MLTLNLDSIIILFSQLWNSVMPSPYTSSSFIILDVLPFYSVVCCKFHPQLI